MSKWSQRLFGVDSVIIAHSAATTAPAGWYPQADGQLRYWDGELWTDQFAPGNAEHKQADRYKQADREPKLSFKARQEKYEREFKQAADPRWNLESHPLDPPGAWPGADVRTQRRAARKREAKLEQDRKIAMNFHGALRKSHIECRWCHHTNCVLFWQTTRTVKGGVSGDAVGYAVLTHGWSSFFGSSSNVTNDVKVTEVTCFACGMTEAVNR